MNDTVLPRLLELIRRLYNETAGFRDHTDDAQLWYNRGYANGMLAALDALGYGNQAGGIVERDAQDPAADQALLPWGQAYRHGHDVGQKETYEVLSPAEAGR